MYRSPTAGGGGGALEGNNDRIMTWIPSTLRHTATATPFIQGPLPVLRPRATVPTSHMAPSHVLNTPSPLPPLTTPSHIPPNARSPPHSPNLTWYQVQTEAAGRAPGQPVCTPHQVLGSNSNPPPPPPPPPPEGCIRRAGASEAAPEALGWRLEEVAEAVGGGYCRFQMPLRLALGVKRTVAAHRLSALEVEGGLPPGPLPIHPCLPPTVRPTPPPMLQVPWEGGGCHGGDWR